jgi:hypothetical protein
VKVSTKLPYRLCISEGDLQLFEDKVGIEGMKYLSVIQQVVILQELQVICSSLKNQIWVERKLL